MQCVQVVNRQCGVLAEQRNVHEKQPAGVADVEPSTSGFSSLLSTYMWSSMTGSASGKYCYTVSVSLSSLVLDCLERSIFNQEVDRFMFC